MSAVIMIPTWDSDYPSPRSLTTGPSLLAVCSAQMDVSPLSKGLVCIAFPGIKKNGQTTTLWGTATPGKNNKTTAKAPQK